MNDKARILVVDEDESVLKTLAQVLSLDGYEVTPCQSGEKAMELVKETAFALALVDARMPDVDGFEVLKGIMTTATKTLVMMITGYASIESAVEAMTGGAYDYLVKPYAPEELRLKVARGLKQRAEEEALRE